MEYSIQAIPTVYADVRFRSRLEARWAAFFDLCGWAWEYEPKVFPGWLPDFALRTGDRQIYCEVKPVSVAGNETALRADFAKALRPFSTVLLGLFPEAVCHSSDGAVHFDFHGEACALGLLCDNGTIRPWMCEIDGEATMRRWKQACRKIDALKRKPRAK